MSKKTKNNTENKEQEKNIEIKITWNVKMEEVRNGSDISSGQQD